MVRAAVVTALLLGARDLERGHFPAVRLRGARITGTGLAVDGDMERNFGFTARGEITLRSARIAGRLTFRDAVLEATGMAARLTRLQADNDQGPTAATGDRAPDLLLRE